MAKKKNIVKDKAVEPVESIKLSELSDSEFLSRIDELSKPYFDAYMGVQPNNDDVQEPATQEVAPVVAKKGKTDKNKCKKPCQGYTKKRKLFVLLTLVLMVCVLAVVVIGQLDNFNINSDWLKDINKYISISMIDGEYVDIIDTITAFVNKTFDKVILESPLDNVFAVTDSNTANGICVNYLLPLASVVYLVFAFVGVIVALRSLFSRRKKGVYKRIGVRFISLVMLVSALIIASVMSIVSGMDILDYVMLKGISLNGSIITQMGILMYIFVAVPVVTFLLSCVSYKKAKTKKVAQ